MSNVLINVVSEFDAKGFKQADSSIAKLTKNVLKFTATLGLARKAQQAMFAAMADEKATKVLAQNLKNLGMAYATIPAEQFIKQMQRQTGILDDELRPAYATLARVTGDMAMTQKIMATAFDVSAGTGQDFSAVINTLSKAYQGNTRGLRTLNIGLSQAELQTKSFNDIIEILNKQFTGAGAASLDTYAGKFAILKVAAADASEVIGMELLNSIQTVSGSTSITELADKINNLAEGMGAVIRNAAIGAKAVLLYVQAFTDPRGALKGFRELQDQIVADTKRWNERNMRVWYPEGFQTDAMKKSAAAALARSKQILANNKKLTAEKKKQLEVDKAIENAKKALGGAANLFDLDRVSVAAAMMNQTLTDNERKRLEIKQAIFNLEDAIDNKDAGRIEAATKILNGLVGQFAIMQNQASLLGQIRAAYDALGINKDLINIKNLQEALDLLLRINAATGSKVNLPSSSGILTQSNRPPSVSPEDWKKVITDLDNAAQETVVTTAATSAISTMAQNMAIGLIKGGQSVGSALSASRYTGQALDWWNKQQAAMTASGSNAPVVNISITDSANDLVKIIYDTVTDQSANGNQPYIVRNGQQLAW